MYAHARSLVAGLISAMVFCLLVLLPQSAQAAILVTTTADAGAGSLRDSIATANASSGPDIIEFAIGSGTTTIYLTTDLPTSTEELVIDGWTQPGWSNFPIISIRPTISATRALGCSAKCTIQGIGGYGNSAHFFQMDAGSDNSVIKGNWIGVNTTTAVFAFSNGIYINAPNVTIGGTGSFDRNVINGSTASLTLTVNANNASVIGNYIGTNATGTVGSSGSLFINGANDVVIGGTTNAERNIFGSNATMVVARYGADNLKVYGNYFGFRPDGTMRIANTLRSISVASSTNIEIGTSTQALPQLLSSHIPAALANIAVSTTLVTDLRLYNNYFNLTASGLVTTGTGYGLQMDHTSNVTIGGTATNERNYFNVGGISGDFVQDISIKNNYFGSDILGTTALGAPRGLTFSNATSLYIGGDTDAERNVMLSTNAGNYGLSVTNGDQIYVKGNYWGVNPSGLQTIYGVWQVTNFTNVTNVQFGSTTTRQVMGSLGGGGIVITNATSIALYNNIVGSNSEKSASLSASANTFRLSNVTSVTVGGGNLNEGNLFVSSNQATFFDKVHDATFYGNVFNLNATGSAQLGGGGILIRDSKQIVFGGSDPGEGNVVIASTNGLFLDSTVYLDRPLNAVVEGNIFGFNTSGTRTFRASTDSIFVDQGYSDVLIKNNSFGWANFANIEMWRNRNVTIQGNYLGYTSSTSLFSGTRRAIYLRETTSTIVGGFIAGEGNYFGTSTSAMVDLGRSTSTRVYGNYLGVTPTGLKLVSTSTQILASTNMYDIHIGGTTPGMGNYITNSRYGIEHGDSINTQILGNVFGMSPTSTAGYGFTLDAIYVGIGSTGTNIGDGTLAGANSIAGAGFIGVEVFRATSTVIYGNYFGTNTSTSVIAPNDRNVSTNQTYLVTIGGSVLGQGNIFGQTDFDSVIINPRSRGTTIQGNVFGTYADHVANLSIGIDAIYLSGEAADTAIVGGLGVNESNWISNAGTGIRVDAYAGTLSIIGNTVVSSSLDGLRVTGDVGAVTVQGNYIGVDASYIVRQNARGVFVDDPTAETLIFGGAVSAEENIVAYNRDAGITVGNAGSGFYLLRNRIYGNGDLQIDLGDDGLTANDANDADVGANGLLNYPIPLGVNGSYAGYAYAGLAAQQIIMDVYFSSSTDSFGRGQLMQYATTVTFMTDGSGLASGFIDVAAYGHDGIDKVAFMAHNASNTSEMSGATGGLLGVALAASSTDNFDNTSDVEFTYTLVNYGSDTLNNLQLEFSRALFFPLVSGITIVSTPVSSDPSIIIDGAFDGDADTSMFNAGASTLNGNTTATISFIINVPHSGTGLFSGYATTSGDVLGFGLQDVSVSGTVPDVGNGLSYDGDLDPTNNTLITSLNLPTFSPPSPAVSFVLDAQTISETAGTATINIILNAATSATDIVATYSVGGTASDPADFITPTGSFTILAGESATSVQVTLVDDATIESDKTIVLSLTSVTPNAITGATTTHTITLQSEDVPPPPELEFTSFGSSANEGDGTVNVELELSAIEASDVLFAYSLTGSAVSPDDFGGLSGSGSILAGDTTTTIAITLADDGFYEGSETLILTLDFISTNAVSGTRMQHTLTVGDNDIQPAVAFVMASSSGLEAGLGSVIIDLVMDATSSLPVGIDYSIGGTAVMGSDIGTLSGYAEIPALSTSTTITINVADDATAELNEDVILILTSASSHSMIGALAVYELFILNDDAAPIAPASVQVGGGALSCNQGTGGCGGSAQQVNASVPTTTEEIVESTQPDEPTKVTPETDSEAPIMSTQPDLVNACMKEVGGICTPYLKSFIRYGAKNDIEEVKKLQLFLRDVKGMKEVKVTGIYDRTSLRAVMKFQAGLGKDVLSPWNLSSPTGYVYITTSRAINRIHCQKNPPKPQIVNTCDTGCLKKIQNSVGNDTYIDVCKKTISCVPLLTKTVVYNAKNNSAVEVERLQVAINIALGRSKKPTRLFDAATRNDVNALVKAYFPEEKANLTIVGGKSGMVGDKLQALLNATWCER